MVMKSADDEGGLGILASASAFVASHRKQPLLPPPQQGEPSSSHATSERGDDTEDDDDDENCSLNGVISRPSSSSLAQIGVDLSAMEYAMADYLSRIKDDGRQGAAALRYCRLCEASSSSYGQLVEHLITSHRLAVLQSMHDLNLAGMLQQWAAYTSPAPDSPALLFSALVASIREVACTTPSSAPASLAPYIKKVLDDGPTAWIMEHAKCKKQQQQQQQQRQEPLAYPICPKTSRACMGEAATKPGRVRPLMSNSEWSSRRR